MFTTPVQYNSHVCFQSGHEGKKRNRHKEWNGLFTNTTAYAENPKESIKKKNLVGLIGKFIRVTGYKVHIKKIDFYILATNNWKNKIFKKLITYNGIKSCQIPSNIYSEGG